MRFTTIFFDLDDTLYPSSCGLWKAIKTRMNDYMEQRMGIPREQIPQLREKYFREYGTTLRGLQANHQVDMQDFLSYVHDLPLQDYLHPDPVQQSVLASLPTRNLIFTNADVHHARRVLGHLELEQYFTEIVDINRMEPACKPSPAAFAVAMKAAGEADASKCIMVDDLPHNVQAAHDLGLFGILYGPQAEGQKQHADAVFNDWTRFPSLLNGSAD